MDISVIVLSTVTIGAISGALWMYAETTSLLNYLLAQPTGQHPPRFRGRVLQRLAEICFVRTGIGKPINRSDANDDAQRKALPSRPDSMADLMQRCLGACESLCKGRDADFGVVEFDKQLRGLRSLANQGARVERYEEVLLSWARASALEVTDNSFKHACLQVGKTEPWRVSGYRSFSALVVRTPAKSIVLWIAFTSEWGSSAPEVSEWLASEGPILKTALQRINERECARRQGEQEKSIVLGVSHDLRAPGSTALFALRSYLDEEGHLLTEHGRRTLESVERHLVEQHELLSDMFTTLKSRNTIQEGEVTSLKEIIEDLRTRYEPIASEKGIVFGAVCSANLRVKCRKDHARRILVNLITNALKYTDRGEVQVVCLEQGDRVECSVCDTGRGILEVDRETLFEPYMRGSNCRDVDGVGLGLVVSKNLAEANAAELLYAPRLAGGSRFTVIFSRANDESREGTDPAVGTKLLGKRVIVSDDDPIVCRMYRRYLSDAGAIIREVHSLQELKLALEQEHCDVLITDYLFHDGSVGELFRSDSCVVLPESIFIVSGAALSGICLPRADARQISMLEKPLSRQQLLGALTKGKV